MAHSQHARIAELYSVVSCVHFHASGFVPVDRVSHNLMQVKVYSAALYFLMPWVFGVDSVESVVCLCVRCAPLLVSWTRQSSTL